MALQNCEMQKEASTAMQILWNTNWLQIWKMEELQIKHDMLKAKHDKLQSNQERNFKMRK